MATTRKKPRAKARARKTAKQRKTKATREPKQPVLPRRKPKPPIAVTEAEKNTALEMKGERLVVKLDRKSHPAIFDMDRLLKQMTKLREANKSKRSFRDLVEFLAETEKSLQIILSNHLEDALRKYLR